MRSERTVLPFRREGNFQAYIRSQKKKENEKKNPAQTAHLRDSLNAKWFGRTNLVNMQSRRCTLRQQLDELSTFPRYAHYSNVTLMLPLHVF